MLTFLSLIRFYEKVARAPRNRRAEALGAAGTRQGKEALVLPAGGVQRRDRAKRAHSLRLYALDRTTPNRAFDLAGIAQAAPRPARQPAWQSW